MMKKKSTRTIVTGKRLTDFKMLLSSQASHCRWNLCVIFGLLFVHTHVSPACILHWITLQMVQLRRQHPETNSKPFIL